QVNLIVASGASGPVQFWDGATTVGDGVIHGGTGTWTNASNNTNWTDPNGNINQSWLSGFGIFAANPGTVTVADTIHYTGLQFSTNGYVVNASGGGTLNPTGQATIRVDNGVTTMIGAPIVGIGGLVVSGPGTLVLTANNAFSGGTTLAGGTLQIGNGATSATLGGDISITGTNTVLRFNQNIALFGGSITETAGASTSLSFAGAQTVLNGPVKLTNSGNAASSVAAGATLQTNNTFALAGGLNLDGAITFAGPSASIAGAITGTGLVQQSGGTTTFTAGTSPTNYTGPTLVSGGTLIAGAANSFSPVSAMSVGSSTVDLGGFAQAINAVALNGGTLQNGGLTGAVTSTGGTINGIGGPAGVTTTSGLTTFSGTNTYTGATHINGGTARGGNANGFSAGSPTSIAGGATLDLGGFAQTINSVALGGGTLQNGALTGAVTSTGGLISGIGGPASVTTTSGVTTFTGATYTGATNINGGTARGGSTNGFSTASRTIIAGGATLDLGGFNQAIASIGGSGTIGNTGAAAATLTTGTSASSVFSGTIIDDAATALTKVGSGTLTLSGANTYSGGTLLNAGTLGIGNSKAFGTGALSMATFTTLQAAGNGFNVANAIALAGADTIDTNGFALTLSGVISGSGSPAITGGGTLTLINANTYAGGTFVNAGTLGIGNGQALGTGAVSMADGTILQAAGNGFNVANAISLAGTGTIDTNGFGLTLSGVLGGTGGLTKIGVGTLTLTGADAYTGPTIINAGALYVDGSIVSPSTVNASGVLGGSGRLGAVTVAGGTLAPGSQGAIGTLTIIGPLGFSASSFYNVRITPTANDQTNVSGTVSPGGASVSLSAAGGSYTLGRRTIVTAGSVNGTFNANVNTPTALAFIRPMLAYDATHVYLDLVGNAPSGAVDYRTAALTYNQFRVATGLTNAAALNPGGVGGIIVGALNGLSTGQAPAVFDSLSGAGIAATQNVAFDASKLFTSAMSDQGRYWREGGPDVSGITVGEVPSFYASTRKGPFDVAVAPPPPPRTLERTWRAWFTGFGQGETVHSQLPLGTSRQDNSLYGGAGGLDYQLMPNTLIGVAAGGSSARFSVPSLATSGSVDGGHIGIYGVTTLGPFYAQSSSTLSVFRNHETRNVTPFGGLNGETERGDFTSKELRSRLEFGRKFIWADFSVTPFAAMEIAKLWSNAFTETGNAGGPGLLTLSVPAASHVSAPAFVGARFEKAFILANGWVFTPSASLAYVHEFSPLRDQFGALAFLPASAFVVDGARPASHAAQVKTGAQLALNSWAAVYADFEGEFSNRAQTYAGKGGVKVSW
ncbi:MAG: hypothetical protein QOG66_1569, partial [Methylobacteriaceae bacterium]|nr:hypothetical protein [Methylobacteriaceae bacterium]